MKNVIIILLLIVMIITSFTFEPIADSMDILAGSTNPTYSTTIDMIAGVSEPGYSYSNYGD